LLYGVLTKAGNTVSFGEIKFGVGREACKQYLFDNPKVTDEIRAKVLVVAKERQVADDAVGRTPTAPSAEPEAPAEE